MIGQVILFEGYDGSGKTTLIDNFKIYLAQHNKSCVLLGRDFNAPIKAITVIIQNKEIEISVQTEILLRLARESERVLALQELLLEFDYILLDRSIISASSWINFYGLEYEKYSSIISDILNFLNSAYLVYCYLPFNLSWTRVNSRAMPLSKKESKGQEINSKMYISLRETFINFTNPSIKKIEIDSSVTREGCLDQLLCALNLPNNDTA